MRIWRTILAGLLGGLVAIAIVRGTTWLSGAEGDVCALLGAAMTGETGAAAWIIGFAAQLMVGMLAAMGYALIFEWVTMRASGLIGALIAIPHVAVAGLSVGFLPASRLLDAGVMPPGAFMEYRGAMVIVGFVLAHLVFGAVVGGLYGGTRHSMSETIPAWHDVTDAVREHPVKE